MMNVETTPAESVDTSQLLQLTGFALAHGIWSVSDGETLCTMVVVETSEGRALTRIPATNLEDAVLLARGNVESLGSALRRSVIVFDGYLTLEGERTDALVAEARIGGKPGALNVVVRYRPATDPLGFAILGEPLFGADLEPMVERQARQVLMRGVNQHVTAAQFWRSHWERGGIEAHL